MRDDILRLGRSDLLQLDAGFGLNLADQIIRLRVVKRDAPAVLASPGSPPAPVDIRLRVLWRLHLNH